MDPLYTKGGWHTCPRSYQSVAMYRARLVQVVSPALEVIKVSLLTVLPPSAQVAFPALEVTKVSL